MFNKIVTSLTEQYVIGFLFIVSVLVALVCVLAQVGLKGCWMKTTAPLHPIFNEKSIYQYTVK